MTRTGGLQNDTKRVEQKLPDARNHQMISFVKSGIRMLGYIFLPFDLTIAMGVLIFSEIIGIIEELV
jgi:hypothetical protein|tara:strand:+ start:2298 stop:2498 length:201 start_codon:yes stop_codon:yes gene_type:complete